MADDRLLALTGGHNFRDFGGYPTPGGGRVRRGVLFRSGLMTHIDADASATLNAIGIVTICDFRTKNERALHPTRWPGTACEIVADDEVPATTTLQALLGDPAATGEAMRAAMIDLYRELPFKHLTTLRLLFARLVAGRVPLVVNCSAGKDRTGVAAALVLRALGVPMAEIVADFLVSNRSIDLPRLLADTGFGHMLRDRPEVTAAMMQVEPAYLAATFDAIDARCGSFDAYLSDRLGVGAGELAQLRAALVE